MYYECHEAEDWYMDPVDETQVVLYFVSIVRLSLQKQTLICLILSIKLP